MRFGDGRRPSAHPQGTCPDASQPSGGSWGASSSVVQRMQHTENDLLQNSELPSSTSARPSRVVGARRCCRSLAGCLPHGLGEAAGPKGRSIRRPQWLAGLQGHDGNCHRRGDASGANIRFVIVSTRRGCCFAIFACGPAQRSCPLLSTISRLSCACTGRVCTRSKWSSRGVRACACEGCWQS